MNKKIKTIATLKIPSGEASSKPPLGSIIGQFGVPIMDFCNLFNKITTEQCYKKGILVNCYLIIYSDFSFNVEVKNIDLGYLLKVSFKDQVLSNKKNLTSKKGRVQSILYGIKKRKHRKKHKKFNFLYLPTSAIYEISKIKYQMLNNNIDFISFYKSIFGSCRSMGFFIFPSEYFNHFFFFKKIFFFFLLKNETEKKKKKYLINKFYNISMFYDKLLK